MNKGAVPAGPQDAETAIVFQPFDVFITNGNLAVRQALSQILTGLDALALAPEETATVELVLAEVMNNIVEHAYPDCPVQGTIRIGCCRRRNSLHFTICDQGAPMPDGQIPLGLPQCVDVGPVDLAEGGYGWFLIKDLAREVRYQRLDHGNQLDVRIAVTFP